jgi:hypothetical protein
MDFVGSRRHDGSSGDVMSTATVNPEEEEQTMDAVAAELRAEGIHNDGRS